MSDKRISETGKNFSEVEMSMSALSEAAQWADELMEAETRSRREKEYTVRRRLAGNIGVSESYLFRLQYKLSEMNDVRGSVYRALMRARRAYGLVADAGEAAFQHERDLADARNSKLVGVADFVRGTKAAPSSDWPRIEQG